jgi:hypothetical protein
MAMGGAAATDVAAGTDAVAGPSNGTDIVATLGAPARF